MGKLNDKFNKWFPDYAFSTDCHWIHDEQYRDFDQQAERLTGLDQDYLQLSPGPFFGRFLSAFLSDDVAVHVECCNQALEQTVAGSADHFCFGVLLSDDAPFRVNGHTLARNDVLIAAPGASMHFFSPTGGAIMAIVVRRERLLSHVAMPAFLADALQQLESNISVVCAPGFASRLREDATQAIETSAFLDSHAPSFAGDALIASIASKLALSWSGAGKHARSTSNAFARFSQCRNVVHQQWSSIGQLASFSEIAGASKRSLEHAFANSLATGPLTYVRLVRLHLARRALLAPVCTHLSIGDVAANYGFWNWSRFTSQYQKQFGELPSQTRAQTRELA